MILLFIFWVLANVAIFINFRAFSSYNVPTFPAIVINYIVCVLTGSIFIAMGWIESPPVFETLQSPSFSTALYIAMGMGSFFIGSFYIMGLTTQLSGVAVASLSARISFVIPVLVNLWIWKSGGKDYDFINYLGLFLAISAVGLVSYKPSKMIDPTEYKPDDNGYNKKKYLAIALPILVFLVSGTIDTTFNYTVREDVQIVLPNQQGIFSVLLFGIAGLTGITVFTIQFLRKKVTMTKRSIIGGICLGIPNFFSIFLLLKVLSGFKGDGALVFPIFNISVILIAAIASYFFFKEKLSLINKLGLALAIFAILLISYQEVIS
jgi:drug/metabolite transporter (DMT)-like permease